MKRAGNLWAQITTEANVHAAFAKAAAGKRDRSEVCAFAARLDENCRSVARDLAAGVFSFGHYRRFTIYEPKERVIHAASFRERVAHHAIIAAIGPVLERRHIAQTFACRLGKGRVAALHYARAAAAACPFFLKMDVRKYFDSIPHDKVREMLERIFKEPHLLACLRSILDSYTTAPGRGLPIGSLISQHLANAYLGPVDRLLKEKLRCRHYARYMDDMALWSGDRQKLRAAETAVQEALASLGLEFKPEPFLNRTAPGMDFLGCRVFPRRLEANHAARVRWVRKIRRLDSALEAGQTTAAAFQRRAIALCANMEVAQSAAFRRRVLMKPMWSDATGLESRQSRRLMEQQCQQQPCGEPQQEQPVQQEQQHRVPSGPSTPWPQAAAWPEAVPASAPSAAEAVAK